ncbi:MAG: NAD(P)H-quinone oxidoreductase [Pseudomonadota bacterium]
MTKTMRAIAISQTGGPEVLTSVEMPVPKPRFGEVVIEVDHAGVNRPDILQRTGAYPPPKDASPLPGLEVAGRVSAVGDGVSRWSVGDAVCALTPGGGYAQYCVVPAAHALPVPTGLTMCEAAALPETAFTVWSNVFMRGGLSAGDWFLVHGGSSGIGTMAIQLAKAKGARVITTAGTDKKCDACRKLGADVAVNYQTGDFVEAVMEATEGQGANVILDMVGGDYVARNMKAAAMDGMIVQIAFLGGPKIEANVTRLMTKRLNWTGSTLRARSDAFKADLAAAVHRDVWPLVEAGAVRPVIDSVFALDHAADAHRRMEAGEHIGKIMLKVGDGQAP